MAYLPTVERVLELFSYDKDTGLFTRRNSCRGCRAGETAGCINGHGYIVIRVDRVLYAAHRLAWHVSFGPLLHSEHIDHINHKKHDNRLINLRKVTNQQNTWNRPGALGAYRAGNKWISKIRRDGKLIHLGTFNTRDEAALAYQREATASRGEYHPI